MNVEAIIQARMGSSRLPGKVMKPLMGLPLLWHVIKRVQACRGIDGVTLATTAAKEDDEICRLAKTLGVTVARLSLKLPNGQNDVLARFVHAAQQTTANTFVRVTADCPLWNPTLGNEVIERYLESPPEIGFASNVHPNLDGFDTEVFSRSVLFEAHREATDDHDRMHVTPWMHRNALSLYVDHVQHMGGLKLSVDTQEDFDRVQAVMEAMGPVSTGYHWSTVRGFARAIINQNQEGKNHGKTQEVGSRI